MLALKGIYENGVVTLEKPPKTSKKMKVIVTFLEEDSPEEPLSLKDFSFMETRQKTSQYNFSLSDAVIEERREGL